MNNQVPLKISVDPSVISEANPIENQNSTTHPSAQFENDPNGFLFAKVQTWLSLLRPGEIEGVLTIYLINTEG